MNQRYSPAVQPAPILAILLVAAAPAAWAEDAAPPSPIPGTPSAEKELVVEDAVFNSVELAEGALVAQVPADWRQVKPRNRIIEAEFAVPNPGDEAAPGRLTVTVAGGSVDANIARWKTQFRDRQGDPQTDKSAVAGMPLTVLDIAGTYVSRPRGPLGPKVEKPGYRMLAGILQTGDHGNYFFKLVGPIDLVEAHAEAFRAVLDSVERTE